MMSEGESSRMQVRFHACIWMLATVVAMILGAALTGCSPSMSASDDAISSGGAGSLSENGDSTSRVSFSLDSGLYEPKEMTVTLSVPTGCTVAYTTDGSVPSADDDKGASSVEVRLDERLTGNIVAHKDLMLIPEYEQEVILDDDALPFGIVVRACSVDGAGGLSDPVTKVFFLGVDFAERFPGCLVISAVTDPENLLDYDTGILATGAVFEEWKDQPEAASVLAHSEWWHVQTNSTQSGKDWERPCYIQIYDSNNSIVAEQNAGMRVTGGVSRSFSQKSFNIYFRSDYGCDSLNYPLFEGVDSYRAFRLRAGGNSAQGLKFKDALLLDLVSDVKCLAAQTRPAVLFLNGEYWGVYLLSEKINDQMICDRYGVDADQVIIMKEGEVDEGVDGDVELYTDVMSYAEKDLSDPAVWDEFCTKMDIQSFADYCAVRIYVGDNDWTPRKNDLLWRTRDKSFNDGRWRYILYDIEFSSGMYEIDATAPEADHLHLAMERYPLFAAAMRNQEFRALFLDSLERVGSHDYNPNRFEQKLGEYLNTWEPLMPDCYKRFGDTSGNWDVTVKQMRAFFEKRYGVIVPIAQSLE